MDLHQLTLEINQIQEEIEHLLFAKKPSLHLDTTSGLYDVGFNGFCYLETFENGILYDLQYALEDMIDLRFRLELDPSKIKVLVESIIKHFETKKRYDTQAYLRFKDGLNDLQLEALKEFEDKQIEVHGKFIDSLRAKYLGEGPEPNSKVTNKSLERITWEGNAKQLVGLFYHLEDKGWIKPSTNKSALVRMLTQVFHVPSSEKLYDTLRSNMQTFDSDKHGPFKSIPPANVNKIS